MTATRIPASKSSEELAEMIYRTRFRFSNEAELQGGIEMLLVSQGIEHEREFSLTPKDRIDFMVGDIGIEVKVDSSVAAVQRQLFRYLLDDRVKEIILVTTKVSHLRIPDVMLDKRLFLVHLLYSIF